MEDFKIRLYQPTDFNAILELFQANTPQYFAPEEKDDLVHYLKDELEEYFVMEYQDKIIGSGGINFSEDKRTGKISWDILDPAFHGQGLGSRLLVYRIDRLQKHWQVAHITVRTSQLVYAFYEMNGFQLLEVVKDYWAPGFDLYRMEFKRKS